MPFLVTDVAESAFPNLHAVEIAASSLGLRHSMLGEWLRRFQSGTEARAGHGHQQVLARELESFLRAELLAQGLEECSARVSDRLGEEVDVACARDCASARLLIEIEFRPNFEKDLVKFMVAREAGAWHWPYWSSPRAAPRSIRGTHLCRRLR